MKKKTGRKKSPTIAKLERQVAKLQEQLAEALHLAPPGPSVNEEESLISEQDEAPEFNEELADEGYGISYDEEQNKYILHTIVFDAESKECAIIDSSAIGKSKYRTICELTKLFSQAIKDCRKN